MMQPFLSLSQSEECILISLSADKIGHRKGHSFLTYKTDVMAAIKKIDLTEQINHYATLWELIPKSRT